MIPEAWPRLDVADWAPTKRSLHRYAQILGKLRLALAPEQPNFTYTSLMLTPRGFTTGTMPVGSRAVAASLDVFDQAIAIEASDGRTERVMLTAPRTVAGVFAEVHQALHALGVDVALSPIPQETPDTTPLDRDERPAVFESLDAQRWLAVLASTNAVFDRWRAFFFGRMGIQLWWGAFDFALLLFNGNHVPAPADRGYLFKYDLDAEMMNAGFYPGDDANAPYFYAYIYPQPPSCDAMAVAPSAASWSDTLHEWVLPYEAVRTSADPAALLAAFLDFVYGVCGNAGWDHAALTYAKPPLRRAR